MGKKKPFIDKKTASVFHVVRRSQRDVGTAATAETLSDFVLMPSPENAVKAQTREEERQRSGEADASTAAGGGGGGNEGTATSTNRTTTNEKGKLDFDTLKSQITAAGLHDETATTYSQYTKPIHHHGTFIPTTTGNLPTEDADNLKQLFTDTAKNTLDAALEEAMAVHEVGRMLDSIALTADCMEDDMAEALFDFEEGEYEEILDDFCFTANQDELEEDENGDGGKDNGEFNYEQHIQMLMNKARAQENGGAEGGRELTNDFFGGVTPLHGRIEEDEDEDDFDYDQYGEEDDDDSLDRELNGQSDKDHSSTPAMNDAQQRVAIQKFEEALLEYDSDDLGDLDEECEEIGGDRPLEGDKQLEAALTEFLTEKEDEILFEGVAQKKRNGGSGYSALVGKTMVHASQLDNNAESSDPSKALMVNMEESKKQMQKDLADADAFLANPEVDLPPEEVFIDGKSYFSVTSRNPWDCESILSTYSNLDNNPVVIGRTKKKKKKKKNAGGADNGDAIPEDAPFKIQLSNKTGLPIGVFDSEHPQGPEEDDYADYDESDTYLSINRGEPRPKQETNMEKKARKLAIKDERKICRMQKKIMKEAFKEEFQKRGMEEVSDAVGGKTVFRFS